MKFSYTQKRELKSFAQRSVVMAPRGMAASSQHLATLAGYRALAKGGNAVDAAVAMIAVLNVVEPHSVGIGGDAFALLYIARENRVLGMNGSGRSPYGARIAKLKERGYSHIPDRGILSVTVPGALHGWAQAVEQYGRLPLTEVFEDAIFYAEHGFPVTEVIAGEWKSAEDLLRDQPESAKTYLIEGNAPRPGQVFKNPDLANTLRGIARSGTKLFYCGEIARAIVDFSRKHDGLFSISDFEDNTTTWVEPITFDYRGYGVYELPPNGQGITALEMLNILQGYDVAGMDHNGPEYLHTLVEAKKMAFADRDRFITDPDVEKVPVETMLSREYADHCRRMINPRKAGAYPSPLLQHHASETAYVTAVDEERNAVSFISSIFMAFGSGMVVDGTGIVLQNRGRSFSLDRAHPNCLAPHKRTLHTIIPGMVFKDGEFLMTFGVMGGDMQPQGHVQFLVNLIDFDMNPQEAMDAPRVRHIGGMDVYAEEGIPESTITLLKEKGHTIVPVDSPVNQVGGGQAIYLDRKQNVLLAASDRRKDGCALGY